MARKRSRRRKAKQFKDVRALPVRRKKPKNPRMQSDPRKPTKPPMPKARAKEGSASGSGTSSNRPITTGMGIDAKYFGGQDYIANRNAGVSDAEILQFLQQNPGRLRGRHQIGGGGIYDQIKSGTVPSHLTQYINLPDEAPEVVDPGLTVDPRIGELEGLVGNQSTQITNLTNQIKQNTANYNERIGNLQSLLASNANQITNYQSQIGQLDQRLLEQARQAKQIKKTDTEYLSGNKALGIRLRRSRKARLGIGAALGTAALNRKNRQALQIGNVNL